MLLVALRVGLIGAYSSSVYMGYINEQPLTGQLTVEYGFFSRAATKWSIQIAWLHSGQAILLKFYSAPQKAHLKALEFVRGRILSYSSYPITFIISAALSC